MLVQIGHVLGSGQLRIGHVEEVATAGQLAEELPGVHVRLVVGGVATSRTEVDGHAAVVAERENVDQLLSDTKADLFCRGYLTNPDIPK